MRSCSSCSMGFWYILSTDAADVVCLSHSQTSCSASRQISLGENWNSFSNERFSGFPVGECPHFPQQRSWVFHHRMHRLPFAHFLCCFYFRANQTENCVFEGWKKARKRKKKFKAQHTVKITLFPIRSTSSRLARIKKTTWRWKIDRTCVAAKFYFISVFDGKS